MHHLDLAALKRTIREHFPLLDIRLIKQLGEGRMSIVVLVNVELS